MSTFYIDPAEEPEYAAECAAAEPPRGWSPRSPFAVHWYSCDTRSPFEHVPHWVDTDQPKLVINNCPGRDANGGVQTPPFENKGN